MKENFGVPQIPANDTEAVERKVETGRELMERARQEVPSEIEARLGCDIAAADPHHAETVIAALMDEYVASEGNGMRHHFEVAAKLRAWVSMAAKLRKLEQDFGIAGLIANDNHTQKTTTAA